MKKKLFFIFVINIFICQFSFANIQNKIIVKVGGEIITSFEIKNKILGTLILSNNTINQENIDKNKKIILDNLIETKLKKNELKNKKFTVDKRRIESYLNQISNNNVEGLKKKFAEYNLSFDLFFQDIETQFKWQQFIYQRYSNKIEINNNSIENEINKILKDKLIVEEVNLSEIQILSNDVSNDKTIANIEDEIKKNGFENTALKFSVANTSTEKGNLGWINLNALSKKIYEKVNKMQPGEISEPIRQQNSILFLKLNKKRQISNDKIDKDELRKKLIQQKQNEIFNLYSMSHLSIIKNKYLVEYK